MRAPDYWRLFFINCLFELTVSMKRLESIQIMRGIAATMVMIHHFTYANPGFAASFPAFTALFQFLARRVDVLCHLRLRYPLRNVLK